MKNKLTIITRKLTCKLFGHKWVLFYVYGIRAHCKCSRCEQTKDDYLDKFFKLD